MFLTTLNGGIRSQCLILLPVTKVVRVAKCRVDRKDVVDYLVPHLLG